MARCAIQSFRRVASRFDYRLDHARRGQACLVSKAAVWTLFGVWRGKLDVFWGYFSALVWRLAQSVAALLQRSRAVQDGRAFERVSAGVKLCPSESVLYFAGFGRSRRRSLARWDFRSRTQHQSQINQFTFPPAPQSVPNLRADPCVRNKSIVKVAPAGVSSGVVSGRPSPFRQGHKTAIVKLHRGRGESAPDAPERQAKKCRLRIAIRRPDQT